jgi:hypothetical protein
MLLSHMLKRRCGRSKKPDWFGLRVEPAPKLCALEFRRENCRLLFVVVVVVGVGVGVVSGCDVGFFVSSFSDDDDDDDDDDVVDDDDDELIGSLIRWTMRFTFASILQLQIIKFSIFILHSSVFMFSSSNLWFCFGFLQFSWQCADTATCSQKDFQSPRIADIGRET